jgi:hypothetical protein
MIADDIRLIDAPTKRGVELAEDYARWWYLKNIHEMEYDSLMTVDEMMRDIMKKNPERLVEVERFVEGQEDYKTLLLTTNLTYVELDEIILSLPHYEYEKLLDKSINILGGSASDFFQKLGESTSLKKTKSPAKGSNGSTKSPAPPGTSSKKQTSQPKESEPISE